jgi:hypothetical protein
MSRRSILRGLAFALVGASVPAAAFVGRELAHPGDAELLNRCQRWKEQTRKFRRMEKRLRVYEANARSQEPQLPPEFFKPIQLIKGVVRVPFNGLGPKDGPWARDRLEFYAAERPFDPRTTPYIGPTPRCQAYCRRLLKHLDKHERAVARAWAPYDRLDRQIERELRHRSKLFHQIMRTNAQTLRGAMAQLALVEADGFLSEGYSPAANKHLLKVMRNIRRLVAALPAEA